MLEFQEQLAKKHNYKKLDKELSDNIRNIYLENIPENLNIKGANSYLYTKEKTPICKRYDRIVVGDYGAFIEISEEDIIISESLKVKEGQEYRYSEKYSHCKYYWLTTKDSSDIKIYHQINVVSYADYIIGKFYVSVHEVRV